MTSVKHFHSGMVGAPTLNNAAGALNALLDACLVNGFGSKTLDSLVVSGGIATGSVSTGHSFEVDTIAEIAGATPSGLNGQKRILSVAGNTFTFDATGISNQTATGTITAKLAPLGWAKPFTGTDLAVFRASNPAGTRAFLQVSDAAGSNAFVRGFEAMSTASAGTGPFPTTAQLSSGLFWLKSSTGSPTNARPWVVIGDDRCFYLWVQPNVTAPAGANGALFFFGDVVPMKPGDPFACMAAGYTYDNSANTSPNPQDVAYSGTSNPGSMLMPRSFTAIGTSTPVHLRGESYFGGASWSGGTGQGVANYPNAADNAILLSRVMCIEGATPALRAIMRGLLFCPQNVTSAFDNRSKLDGRGAYAGRKLMAISSGTPAGGSKGAIVFFDITGPWG